MQNVMLCYPNYAQQGTLSGGNWQATLPLTNLLTRDLEQPARSASAAEADTQFTLTLPRQRNLRVINLANHTLSLLSTYRIVLRDLPAGAVVFDSGWLDVWPVMFNNATLPWLSPNWWNGKPEEEQISRYPRNLIHVLPGLVFAQVIEVYLRDTANPAGSVDVSHVFVAGQFQPRFNHSYGARRGHRSRSELSELKSGRRFADPNTPQRSASFSLDWLTPEDATTLYDMQRQADVWDWLLYIPDADDALNLQRHSFLAHFADLQDIGHPYFRNYQNQINLLEVM